MILTLALLLMLSCSRKESRVKAEEDLTPPELLELADQYYQQGNSEKAFATYSIIYEDFPDSREYIDAVIGLARTYNDLGKYEKGMSMLYDLLRENMMPQKVPQIYNELAHYYEVNAGVSSVTGISDEQTDFLEAIDYYEKAVSYPNSDDQEAKSFAQYKIGEIYLKLGRFGDAAVALKTTADTYPETKWAVESRKQLQEMRDSARKVIQSTQYPDSARGVENFGGSDTLQSQPPDTSNF